MSLDMVQRLLQPLRTRIAQLITVGTVTNSSDDGDVQILQVRAANKEPLAGVQNAQPYGFASRAKEGARALLFMAGGWRARAIAGAVMDSRFRLKNLARGEVAIYDDQGNWVWMKRDGIEVKGITKVTVAAPDIEFSGALNVTGSLTMNGVPGMADSDGNSIHLTPAGLVIDSTSKVTVTAPEVDVTAPAINLVGGVAITGSLSVNGVGVP